MTRDSLIHRIARDTHNKWVIRMKMSGWKLGDSYDEDKRQNPRLKNYDQLSVKEQEYCLVTATEAVDTLLAYGHTSFVRDIVPVDFTRIDLIWLIDKQSEILENLLLLSLLTGVEAEAEVEESTRVKVTDILTEARKVVYTATLVIPRAR